MKRVIREIERIEEAVLEAVLQKEQQRGCKMTENIVLGKSSESSRRRREKRLDDHQRR